MQPLLQPPPNRRFNPRAREGRDASRRAHWRVSHVSIHAPARGATGRTLRAGAAYRFQSTRPRGARHRGFSVSERTRVFQSTRPRGARRDLLRQIHILCSFNPRAREGRDVPVAVMPDVPPVSFNPRAREGRDGGWPTGSRRRGTFQSTRPRGARHVFPRINCPSLPVSIHAPARGATRRA